MLTTKLNAQEKMLIDTILDDVFNLNISSIAKSYLVKRTDCPKSLWQWEKDNRASFDKHLIITCGSTKIVLVHEQLKNWVIKIPFLFSPKFSLGFKSYSDFCAIEMNNYEKATQENIGFYFAPTYLYDCRDDIPIYIQSKATFDEGENEVIFANYWSQTYGSEIGMEDDDEAGDSALDYIDDLDDTDRIEAIFGGEISDLLSFLDKYEINDIHAGNFGYIDGNPVLIDYSGY